jgi:predicted nucleic acid-binding Zn ribbon protein
MSEAKKCAHAACSYSVPEGKKYCSQMCEDSASITSLKCNCNHPACS